MILLYLFLFPVSLLSMDATKILTLNEQDVVDSYEKYAEGEKERVVQLLRTALKNSFYEEVPTLVDQCKFCLHKNFKRFDKESQSVIEESLQSIEGDPKIDFITLAFHSAITDRYQKLVLKIAEMIPDLYVNEGINHCKEFNRRYQINDAVDFIRPIIKNISQKKGKELLYLAIEFHQNEIARKLILKNKDNPGQFLINAAVNNNVDIAQHLVRLGTLINGRDSAEQTALHYATLFNCTETIQFLLENGGDPNLEVEWFLGGIKGGISFNILDSAIGFKGGIPLTLLDAFRLGKHQSLEKNFEEKREICKLIASKSSLKAINHSYNETFKFLPEASPVKLFLKEQMDLKSQK